MFPAVFRMRQVRRLASLTSYRCAVIGSATAGGGSAAGAALASRAAFRAAHVEPMPASIDAGLFNVRLQTEQCMAISPALAGPEGRGGNGLDQIVQTW